MKKHPIDEHFRKALYGHRVTPSDDLWTRLETRIEKPQGKKMLYLRYAAAIALLIGLAGIMTNFIGPKSETSIPDIESRTFQPLVSDIDLRATLIRTVALPVVHLPARSTKRVLAEAVEPQEVIEENAMADVGQMEELSFGKDVEIRFHINPNKYLLQGNDSLLTAKVPESKRSIGAFAQDQFNNLISGKEIETPTKEKIEWPELRFSLQPFINKFSASGEK